MRLAHSWAMVLSANWLFCSGLAANTVQAVDDATVAPIPVAIEEVTKGVSLPDPVEMAKRAQFRGPYRSLEPFGDQRFDPEKKVLRCKGKDCDSVGQELLIKMAPADGISRFSVDPQVELTSAVAGLEMEPLFKAGVNSMRRFGAMSDQEQQARKQLARWYRAKLPRGGDREALITQLAARSDIEWIEEPQVRALTGKPAVSSSDFDDPRYAEQWHIPSTQTPEAWTYLEGKDLPTGGHGDIVVAVIDSGVDYTHPDLKLNMWVNQGETANGQDSDGNGFVDDIHGVSVLGSSWDHNGDPMDDHGHGTHVAGIIAARANNGEGGVGIAHNVKIMAIKAAQYTGILTSADIAEGIHYAVEHGADVINMSFGGTGYSQAEQDALGLAFGQAVLVASAGNNGRTNDPYCDPLNFERMYPAAYPWVVGVMAEAEFPNGNGDKLAGFSNWDCIADDNVEYELMAPGSNILSTIPGGGYAKWDGTSMAAPVVSGIAALVRTRFDDKAKYSSRFIMGQVAATGQVTQGITYDPKKAPLSYHSVDAYQALTNTPKPQLSYLEHYLWDEKATSDANNNNGKVDAGETIDLALIVRNQWGQADNVQVTVAAQVDGAIGPDPYVEWLIDSVNYNSVGTFGNDDNGLIYDGEGVVTGVENPFRFRVREDTPNNHVINFQVNFTAQNGLDPDDSNTYQFQSEFQLLVSRGIELPSILSGDLPGTPGGDLDTDGVADGVITLDANALYIIDKPVLIEAGTTLKMGPGVQVQFWGSQPDDVYAQFKNSYLQVDGSLIVEGTADAPVVLAPSTLFPDRMVVIRTSGGSNIDVQFAELTNIKLDEYTNAKFDRVEFKRGQESLHLYYTRNPDTYWEYESSIKIYGSEVYNSRFTGLGYPAQWYYYSHVRLPRSISGSLIDNSFVQNVHAYYFSDGEVSVSSYDEVGSNNTFLGNVKSTSYDGLAASKLYKPTSMSASYSVEAPLAYNGKIYYRTSLSGWNWQDAQRFVDSLSANGHLLTVSDEAEFDAISDWLYGFKSDQWDEWSSRANVGYVLQESGDYVWSNGESPTYDFLDGQVYWPNHSHDPEVVTIDGVQPFLPYLHRQLEERKWDINCGGSGTDPAACDFEPEGELTEEWLEQRLTKFADDHAWYRLDSMLKNQGYDNYEACRSDNYYQCANAETDAQWVINQKQSWFESCLGGYQYACKYQPVDYQEFKRSWGIEYRTLKNERVRPDYTTDAFILELETDPGVNTVRSALELFIETDFQSDSAFRNNAILNRYWDPNPDRWMQIETATRSGDKAYEDFSGNFWGTTSQTLIDHTVVDYHDDFNRNVAKLDPILIDAPESAYPFVADLQLLDGDGNPRPDGKFGAEAMIWRAKFNRDMDTDVQPKVFFGPDFPYTDFPVAGDWIDARTWQGKVHISPVASDGYQYARIQGAVAADDAWLVTGNDYARYRFHVASGGLEALNLQASGGEGFVELSWSQDDFETLYGFNLYRSTEANSGYQRIHQSMIDNETRTYRDENVEPGQLYYYQFRVMSAAGESDPSNTASATPVDTVPPVISHTPVVSAGYGANVLVQATVTDNIAVQGVSLYYRTQGQGSYQTLAMTSQQNSVYRATVPGSVVQAPGVEYYIEATDGTSYAYSGRSATPHRIVVNDAPVITQLSPTSGPATGGTELTLVGSNFKSGASIKLGESECEAPQLISGSELRCISGPQVPSTVDVVVTNPDDKSGRLAGGFTFQSADVTVGIADFEAGYGQTLDVPVRVSNVSGLKAFELDIDFDSSLLRLEQVRKGALASAWSLSDHQPADGQLRLAAASGGSSAVGDGSLVMLEFTVIGNEDMSGDIDVVRAALNDGAIETTRYSGSVSVVAGYALTGGITHWLGHALADTQVVLDNGTSLSKTNEQGQYALAGVRSGAHTLHATREQGSEAITAYDASLMLKHITGSESLTGFALMAADLNGDGSVMAMEANAVLEFAAGLTSLPLPGTPAMWGFSPASYQYDDLHSDLGGQDFIGWLMGDPSGNVSGDAMSQQSDATALLYNRRELADGLIALDLYVGGVNSQVSAIDAIFEFDPAHVSLQQVSQGVVTEDWSAVINGQTPGRLQIAMASAKPLPANGSVLTLNFTRSTALESALSLGNLQLNEQPVTIAPMPVINAPSDVDGDGIPDYWELEHGLNPFDPRDADEDWDDDGLTNREEYESGTDPSNPDTDGDGVLDGDDAFPLDPNESQDSNGNGIGDNSDPDIDGDGVANFVDPAPRDKADKDFSQFLKPELGGSSLALAQSFSAMLDNQGRLQLQGAGPDDSASVGLRTLSGDAMFRTIAAGESHLMALDVEGRLYGIGSNDLGQLGLSDRTARTTLTPLAQESIWLQVATGAAYTVALDLDGQLWGWGLIPGQDESITAPVQVDASRRWSKIAAGQDHLLLIDELGRLFAMGQGDEGQLGQGDLLVQSQPVQVGQASDWVRISAGQSHSLAIAADGSLWSWGANADGQLGLDDSSPRLIPSRVGQSTRWTGLRAAGNVSLAQQNNDSLWLWGNNNAGQSGQGDGSAIHQPRKLPTGCDLIRCVWQHTQLGFDGVMAVDQQGQLFSWGDNRSQRLIPTSTSLVTEPTQLNSSKDWAVDSDRDGIHDAADPFEDDPMRAWVFADEPEEPEEPIDPDEPDTGKKSSGGALSLWLIVIMGLAWRRRWHR
ncbi:S8 family serine peptidase [Ferrimonas pelagia]|uniref:Uncharacterized protein n=1 Tax=Ferrimonas pelagia TaxID=1177826 RepID=A0ABP9ES69_9GAMM